MCQGHHLMRGHGLELVIAPDLTPASAARKPVAQAQHVAGNVAPGGAAGFELPSHVVAHLCFNDFARQPAGCLTEECFIPGCQPPGVVIGLAPYHHAIEMLQMCGQLPRIGDTAVDGDGQMRKLFLQLMHHLITQRRHFTVFFRAQALEPGVACVHDEHLAACIADSAHKIPHKTVALGLVYTNAVLDGDRHAHHIDHGLHTIGYQLRLGHQAGAKRPTLHTLAGATAVEVDLVVTPLLAKLCAMRQISRLAAAKLKGNRVFLGIEAKVPGYIAMNQGTGSDHFGIQQGMARQQAVEIAAMAICPVHHGRYRDTPRAPWAARRIRRGVQQRCWWIKSRHPPFSQKAKVPKPHRRVIWLQAPDKQTSQARHTAIHRLQLQQEVSHARFHNDQSIEKAPR